MASQHEIDDARIAAAIEFLVRNYRQRPALAEIADHVHMSRYHFQRMFREWVGVTPKQFAGYLSVEHAKNVLKQTRATLCEAASEAGLSTSSRLHDLFVNIDGMPPGEYKNGGKSLTIRYSFAQTLFGEVLVASTGKGICHLAFTDENRQKALDHLKRLFPNASYREEGDGDQRNALSVFRQDWNDLKRIKLHLKATDFQLKVWQALLQVPEGGLTTYSDLALRSGHEGTQRAVGTALGANPVVFLIPCHRVIKASGIIGNYHYGEERKNAMIGWEAAMLDKKRNG